MAKRSRGVCHNCGKKASRAKINARGILCFYDEAGIIFHVDHILPIRDGGGHGEKNLSMACAKCNMSVRKKKAANDPEIIELLGRVNGKK